MRKRMDEADLPPVVMPNCEIRRTLSGQKALVTGARLRSRPTWVLAMPAT